MSHSEITIDEQLLVWLFSRKFQIGFNSVGAIKYSNCRNCCFLCAGGACKRRNLLVTGIVQGCFIVIMGVMNSRVSQLPRRLCSSGITGLLAVKYFFQHSHIVSNGRTDICSLCRTRLEHPFAACKMFLQRKERL